LIKKICDVHYGIGSDGILVKCNSDVADFKLRIFNPDGSEAEKSGNGLRIFVNFFMIMAIQTKKSLQLKQKVVL
jgi:Diaminopimelate epimerase